VRNRHHKSGFTIVEMMVATGIAFTAIALSLSSFMMLSTAATSSSAYTLIHSELRHAMDEIERDVRAGIRVTWSEGTTGDRIVLQIKTETGNTYVYFYKIGSNLYRWKSDSFKAIAEGVNTVEFTMLDSDGNETSTTSQAVSLKVTLGSSTTVISKTCEDTIQTCITMRNVDV
jgi:type II secretory pathway pseudopilin PulG